MKRATLVLFTLLSAGLAAFADLAPVKAIPDPNKRAEMAIDHAEQELGAARTAWNAGDWNAAAAALDELRASAELADSSLQQSSGQPRNNKHYKRIELRLRDLIRRIDGLRNDVDYDHREEVNKIETRVQEVHDEILAAIMTKRR
jgi:hypothetical protein